MAIDHDGGRKSRPAEYASMKTLLAIVGYLTLAVLAAALIHSALQRNPVAAGNAALGGALITLLALGTLVGVVEWIDRKKG